MIRHRTRWIVIGGMLVLLILVGFIYGTYTGHFSTTFASAAATSALVLVTYSSVALTLRLLQEQRQERLQDIRPMFAEYLEGEPGGHLGVVLENIGNGPAQDIRVKLTLEPEGESKEVTYYNIPPGNRIRITDPFEATKLTLQNLNRYKNIRIEGEVRDLIDNKYPIRDTISLDEAIERNIVREQNNQVIKQELEAIGNELAEIKDRIDK